MKEGLFTLPGRAAVALLSGTLRFIVATLRSARMLPALVLKPKVFLLWLGRSHLAQLLLVATLLLMPQITPTASDRMLALVYQPVETTVLGLIPITKSHPKLKERQTQLRYVLNYGSGALVFFAFWFSIPAALKRGERVASSKEEQADKLIGTTPSGSVVLYRQAITFATDSDHLAALRNKLEALDRNVRDAAPGDKTVVMSIDHYTAPGQGLGQRYETERELGRGAMGVVLLANDTVLERKVAIKELPHNVTDDPKLLERFRREAKAMARINHPGIIQVYDFAEFQGSAWIVMEYVAGKELGKGKKGKEPLAPAEVVRLAKLMSEALEYAHNKGVLHRDLKPANIIVDGQGQPKIMDFGVARLALSGDQTQPGTILGSPSYMSPEQALGKKVDVQADVYSLGAVLYGLLAGRPMFDGTISEVLGQVIHQKPEPIRRIMKKTPLKLAKLVMSMVDKKANARPASMTAVLEQLSHIHIKQNTSAT